MLAQPYIYQRMSYNKVSKTCLRYVLGVRLRCGHNQKNEGLRCGYRKRGYLELVLKKERVLRTEVSQKRGLGSLFIIIIFTITCQNNQSVGVFCQTERGRGF